MKAMWRILNSGGVVVAALLWLGFWAITNLWPAGWFFTVHRVDVFDSIVNEEVYMNVEREIHRPFEGKWAVIVRRFNGSGWTTHCTAIGYSDYRPDADLPEPLTLDWWTDGECPTIAEPGQYFISTIWTILGSAILPDKRVLTESNIFQVR